VAAAAKTLTKSGGEGKKKHVHRHHANRHAISSAASATGYRVTWYQPRLRSYRYAIWLPVKAALLACSISRNLFIWRYVASFLLVNKYRGLLVISFDLLHLFGILLMLPPLLASAIERNIPVLLPTIIETFA